MSVSKFSRLAILIPIHNGIEYTKKSLANIKKNLPDSLSSSTTIIVIDDGSKDGSSNWIKDNFSETIIIEGTGDLWWSESINQGVKYAINNLNCEYFLLWNNDILAKDNYFEIIENYIKKESKLSIIGSRIYQLSNPEIIWSNGGKLIPVIGLRKQIFSKLNESRVKDRIMHVDWLTGMGTLVSKEVIQEIGLWDSKNFPQYLGDLEFSYRAKKKGVTLIVDPALKIWNDTSNSGADLNIKFTSFFSSLFKRHSNRSIKTEVKFMIKHRLFPLGLIGYVQRVFFEFIRLLKNKVSKIWG